MPVTTQTKSSAINLPLSKQVKDLKSPGAREDKMLELKGKQSQAKKDNQQTEQEGMIFRRAALARDNREKHHREMNDMTYMQDYQANMDAGNSYLRPKVNDDEVRVNTATTEKKIEVVMNELLSMNIKHEVLAFDQNDIELVMLGKDFEDIVTRTNEIEREEDVWVDIYREFLTQRAVFVEEVFVNRKTRTQNIKRAEKRVLPGRKVYLGDLNIPLYRLNEQPYIVIYDRMHYDDAKTIYQAINPEAWEKVQSGGAVFSDLSQQSGFYQWRLHPLDQKEVEILTYYSYPDDEYQVLVNNVPMFKVGTPLPYDFEGYPIAAANVKPSRTNFAYGRSYVSSAKTLQALENETIRNLVRKFRQAIEPPMGTQSKTVFSRDIWAPAAVTQGIRKDDMFPLIDHNGVTNSEFAMYQLISSITEEFIGVSNIQQGISGPTEKTATQALEELRQGIKMLGLAVLGAIRLRRDLTYLRIYTVLKNNTQPVGKALQKDTQEIINKFTRFTLNKTDVGGGRRGKKIIQFSDRDLTGQEQEDLFDLEEELEERGEIIRFRNVNVKKLKEFPIVWYVTARQTEREGSALDKIMHQQKINQIAEVEALSQGQVRGNWDRIAEQTEAVWRSNDLFQTAPPQSLQEGGDEETSQAAQDVLNSLGQVKSGVPNVNRLTEAQDRQTRAPSPAQAARRS